MSLSWRQTALAALVVTVGCASKTIFGQQAHRYASCDVEVETSWALLRE